MAYMHTKTFEILNVHDYRISKFQNDYFEIDDLIALPIQGLNLKGYFTKFCCAGHPFDYLLEPDETEFDSDVDCTQAEIRAEDIISYILFEENISLPALPPGFVIGKNSEVINTQLLIEKHHSHNDDIYTFMSDVLESMRQLYEWTLILPENYTGTLKVENK